MLFKISRSVPANTTRDNPDWQKLRVMKGTIIQWIVFMPEEAADLLRFMVEYHGVQILPFNRPESIYGMNKPVPIPEKIKVDDAPYELDVFAWNSDDTYSHEYNLHVNIEPHEAVKPKAESYEGLWEKIRGWIGGD